MSKLMGSIGRSIIDQIFVSLYNHETKGLVRLFEVEYQTDYRHAIENGAIITDEYVLNFLRHNKQPH